MKADRIAVSRREQLLSPYAALRDSFYPKFAVSVNPPPNIRRITRVK
jgi:hypothetical protein